MRSNVGGFVEWSQWLGYLPMTARLEESPLVAVTVILEVLGSILAKPVGNLSQEKLKQKGTAYRTLQRHNVQQ